MANDMPTASLSGRRIIVTRSAQRAGALSKMFREAGAEVIEIAVTDTVDPADNGQALREALGDKAGIRRFGDSMVPLDEVLVQAAVDLSGRPYLVHRQPEIVELIGTFDTTLGKHIWESIVAEARIALHIRVLEGRNAHHVFEAQFKAVARALRDAVSLDGRVAGIPSTKGSL